MNHNCKPCQQHLKDEGLSGFGAGELSLAQVLTNPNEVIETYKQQAIVYGAYVVGALVILNHLQLHIALNQKLKRFMRR
jgi:hypothetical protein